jgi:hypothetical protein
VRLFLKKNENLVMELQGLLFFRRPAALIALVALVNGALFLYRWAALTFYASFLLCLACVIVVPVLHPVIWPMLDDMFFIERLEKGKPTDLDRIRDANEVADIVVPISVKFCAACRLVSAISQDKSPTGLSVWASLLFGLFVLTAAVDWFWIIFATVNCILVLPGILVNAMVIDFVRRAGIEVSWAS